MTCLGLDPETGTAPSMHIFYLENRGTTEMLGLSVSGIGGSAPTAERVAVTVGGYTADRSDPAVYWGPTFLDHRKAAAVADVMAEPSHPLSAPPLPRSDE